ncbi:MAG: GNAT family N-acetyltransferase [Fidelibacterota bacterium]
MSFKIRCYRPDDFNAIYKICLETGDSGKDATELFNDPDLLGHLYSGPYVILEPESAFILEDAMGPCGYIIGALDSESFYKKMNDLWLPQIRKKYTDPKPGLTQWTKDEELIHHLFHPKEPVILPDYPSHLHIDLLSRAQGQGQGKKMMDHFFQYLKVNHSKGIHLGLSIHNNRAFHFYKQYGMTELFRNSDAIIMGFSFE